MARNQGPFPSGPDDRIGAANFVTDREVLRALSLVKGGCIVDLSVPIDAESPGSPASMCRL